MERILVLVDGSKWSQKAALYALQIAKRSRAEVVLFSVLDRREAKALAFTLGMRSDRIRYLEKFEETVWRDMKNNIEKVLQAILKECVDIRCHLKIVGGSTGEKILEEANSENYSLVIMGAYGRSGKKRIGSLLEEIVGRIEPPVMIVR